jgi:segregation and condensation protein B
MSQETENRLMAVLFAAGEPISLQRLALALEMDAETVRKLTERLRGQLEEEDGALVVLRLEDHYQLAARERYTPLIRKVLTERRNTPLSQASLEVLAAVAYNQPVTRAYVEQVRGVDCAGIITSLTEKGLLEEAGRLELPGRPITYRTTANFLRTFGLTSLADLPPIEQLADTPDGMLEGQTALLAHGQGG